MLVFDAFGPIGSVMKFAADDRESVTASRGLSFSVDTEDRSGDGGTWAV
jgi:hypothetical protein